MVSYHQFVTSFARCLPDMSKVGASWPDILECSKFPERNDGENSMCMQGEDHIMTYIVLLDSLFISKATKVHQVKHSFGKMVLKRVN